MGKRCARDERKEQYWRGLVADWQASGLSVRAFCRRRLLSEASFYGWRRELRERDAVAGRSAFVPVQVVDSEAAVSPGFGIEVVLSGERSVRIGPGFDADTLRRVLAVLEEESC
jgi:transposase